MQNDDKQPKKPILKVGNEVNFSIPLLVLRAFASEEDENLYYIVGLKKTGAPVRQGYMWGVLKYDGSYDAVPMSVMERAASLVQTENLLDKLE